MRPSFRFSLVLAVLTACCGVARAEVTLTTDKPAYTVGETVHITAHNSGPEDLELVSTPWFVIRNEDTGQCLFGCLGLPELTPFPAGATIAMDRDTGLGPDLPGNHVVWLALNDGPSASYSLSAQVPAARRSWGTLKARFR